MHTVSSLPWRKHIVDAPESMTMSCTEEGVYERLKNVQWRLGYLPDDRLEIQRLARVTGRELNATWTVLEPLFPLDEPGRRRHPDLKSEREHVLQTQAKRSRSARKRWEGESATRTLEEAS